MRRRHRRAGHPSTCLRHVQTPRVPRRDARLYHLAGTRVCGNLLASTRAAVVPDDHLNRLTTRGGIDGSGGEAVHLYGAASSCVVRALAP